MKRQLNPHLFQNPAQEGVKSATGGGRLSSMAFVGPETSSLADSRIQNIETELFHQKKKTQEMHQYLEKLTEHMQEWMGTEKSRGEKVNRAIETLSARYKHLAQESQSKLMQINDKVNERRNTEAKVEELVDRQNSLMRSFESRMAQLQRLVADQEKQLASSAASLNEAKLEIMKLKRLI